MASGASPASMSETAEFTPHAAAQALAEATRYEDALRQRTEGLTWMIWGIATPAIWLSYGFAGATLPADWPLWAEMLWVPWVFAGVLTTVALWRSAALAAPRIAANGRKGWVVGLAWVVVTAVMWGAIVGLGPVVNESLIPLFVLGSAWTLFGAVNLNRCSSRGKRVSLAIGVATLAAAFALLPFAGTTHEDYVAATIGSVVASAVFPLAGGLWQTLRA